MCRATLPDLRWGSGGRVWGSQERWAGATRMCVGWREGRGPLGLLEAQGFSPRPVMSAEGEGQRSPRPAREKPARLGLAPSRGKAGGLEVPARRPAWGILKASQSQSIYRLVGKVVLPFFAGLSRFPTSAWPGAPVDGFPGEPAGGWTAARGGESGVRPASPCGGPARRAWGPGGGEIAAVDPPLSLMKFKFV